MGQAPVAIMSQDFKGTYQSPIADFSGKQVQLRADDSSWPLLPPSRGKVYIFSENNEQRRGSSLTGLICIRFKAYSFGLYVSLEQYTLGKFRQIFLGTGSGN